MMLKNKKAIYVTVGVDQVNQQLYMLSCNPSQKDCKSNGKKKAENIRPGLPHRTFELTSDDFGIRLMEYFMFLGVSENDSLNLVKEVAKSLAEKMENKSHEII